MFRDARIKLTLLYSFIFLTLFWALSAGIYLWMNRYFGDEGNRNYIRIHHEKSLLENSGGAFSEPPSDIIMDELRMVLIVLDLGLLFIIPSITWFLTGRTLAPVQIAHDKEKQFLTDASHDLRTPLSILSSELEVTLQKDRTKEEYKKVLQSNREEVNDLIALVENMLFLSREDPTYQTAQKEIVDLTDLLAERVATFQKLVSKKRLTMLLDLPDRSVSIEGNVQLLKRLITSLLDNAIKYTPSDGKITVQLNLESKLGKVKITDTGIGIPKEHQEKVFNRFFRSDTSRSQKGYGLGLSIAKQIMEFHHGKISIHSTVGKGTTITLSFPAVTQTRGKNQS